MKYSQTRLPHTPQEGDRPYLNIASGILPNFFLKNVPFFLANMIGKKIMSKDNRKAEKNGKY